MTCACVIAGHVHVCLCAVQGMCLSVCVVHDRSYLDISALWFLLDGSFSALANSNCKRHKFDI